MNTKVKKAVILAAGMGTRLSEKIREIPKGFIQFGDKPIIEESIEKLLGFSTFKNFRILIFLTIGKLKFNLVN